ncbi:MAG TPA: hypothetical protein VJL85_02710 [Gaiellaceae bacterium]|jgi:hypothetical protein|nr:hypothetical protein [Gaiellaceae bacterium]
MRRRPLLCLCLALAAAGCGGSTTLTEHGLSKEADTIQSTAAEGALLAGEVARGRTTEPFARVHSGELAEQAKSVAANLRRARAPGLEPKRREALGRALRIEQALVRLHSAATDRRSAARIARELERLAR